MDPITDVKDISRIGFGFMASKVLFATLNLDIYTRIAQGIDTIDALTSATGVTPNRLLTLLTANVSLGLLTHEEGRYQNAPATATYLVRTARAYYGDYFRYQIDRQFYPYLQHLDAALAGEEVTPFYEMMAAAPEEATHFTRAQHTGSLGPAYLLTKQLEMHKLNQVLDVAGGSGAFSIMFCQKNPNLRATLVDFPNVLHTAREFVAQANLLDRIDFLPGSALEVEWPAGQDAVIMSYLLSSVTDSEIDELFDRAYQSLNPGGILILHDFMVEDDLSGPTTAALFSVPFLYKPDVHVLTPGMLTRRLEEAGYADLTVQELLPDITKAILAVKSERSLHATHRRYQADSDHGPAQRRGPGRSLPGRPQDAEHVPGREPYREGDPRG